MAVKESYSYENQVECSANTQLRLVVVAAAVFNCLI